MATASTKRRAGKKSRAGAKQTTGTGARSVELTDADADSPVVSEKFWTWASVVILAVAAFLRFYALELKPMHHDEGVNGFFLTTLLREGKYFYDPTNYHGPSLYYFALPTAATFGLNAFGVRLVPALFGLATVFLVLCLRRHIGTVAALAGAALVAVSPGAVYQSRYFIHESMFVFFALGVVVAAVWFLDTRRAVYLMLASASLALLFTTKETAIITAIVLALAAGVTWGYMSLAESLGWARKRMTGSPGAASGGGELAGLFGGDPTRAALLLLEASALFVAINVLLYSSFFTNMKGVSDAISALKVWTETGVSEFHAKPWQTYLTWMQQEELPLFLLAVAGSTLALSLSRNRFAIFAGAWAFGTLAAYSLVPYKTPWLMLNFTVPLALVAGYAVERLCTWSARASYGRAAGTVVLGAALAVGAYQAWVLNFREYDNDRYPYVYSHTRRDVFRLLSEIERLSKAAGTGTDTRIAVAAPEYWPLPWYLNGYKHVGFHGRSGAYTDALVIGSAKEPEASQIRAALGANYRQVGPAYALRPGVDLTIYARSDVSGR